MKLTWRRGAFLQLQRIYEYIAKDNPSAARKVVQRIEATAADLGAHPWLGEEAGSPNYRTKVVPDYPYRIFYRVFPQKGEVRIVRVRDTRRRP